MKTNCRIEQSSQEQADLPNAKSSTGETKAIYFLKDVKRVSFSPAR